MENEAAAPSDLEMELRRNLTPCVCNHAFMQHNDDIDHPTNCLVCSCRKYKELLVGA